ncbi:ParA family protein [Savagea faecisuis]|uniref:ParA family protein n=1 Tax=Savagea faecisuis TaxID=1274803 RepID=A0ABW3GXD7_9BACL
MATVITFGNFKGGVGKTTSACMTSILLAEKGYKTLHVDFDPQADSTEFLANVHDYELKEDYISLFESLKEDRSLKRAIISIADNLSLLPSGADLVGYERLVHEIVGDREGTEHFVLDAFLTEVRADYDVIVIDVPPTLNVYNSNALLASDAVVVVMKTQRKSLNATRKYLNFIEELNEVRKHYDYNILKVAGVLPYLQKKSSPLDDEIIKAANEEFSELLFEKHILERERIKRYDEEGISFKQMDVHDKNVFKMYRDVTEELLQRLNK